jgi:hypothetical protein
VENTNDNEETLVGGAVIVQIESHPPTKRKRGRPPKKTTQPDNWVPMVASTHHGTTNGNPSSLDGPGIPADGSEGIEDPYIGEENISAPFVPENLSSAHAPDLGGGDDISDILMNTSLEKTPHLPQVQKPVNNNTKNNSNRSNSTEAEHDGSDDGSENGPDPEILPSPHLTYSQRPHKASSQRDFEIDLDAFEIISANLKRVGQKSNKKNGLKPVKKAKVKSKTANRLARKLDLLNKAYDNLRTAKEAGESEEDAKTAFVAVYDALKMATERLVSDHLDPRKAHSTKEILTDLYFVILQQYTHVILVGAKFYSDSDFVESEALLELSKLLDLLYGLVESALGLPKECQPIAPGYKTVQPIRAVRPVIARLRSALRDEIEDRKRKQKLAESKVLEAKRLKDRQDEEKRLKLKKRREKKEIHKQQARAIERLYADPICGRYLKSQEAKMAGRRRAKSAVSAAGRQYHEVDDDPFADDDIERVRVIPKNNNRQHKKKPFSKKEVGRFVDIMRVERGMPLFLPASANDRTLTIHRG